MPSLCMPAFAAGIIKLIEFNGPRAVDLTKTFESLYSDLPIDSQGPYASVFWVCDDWRCVVLASCLTPEALARHEIAETCAYRVRVELEELNALGREEVIRIIMEDGHAGLALAKASGGTKKLRGILQCDPTDADAIRTSMHQARSHVDRLGRKTPVYPHGQCLNILLQGWIRSE
jgi:hypothetical protein